MKSHRSAALRSTPEDGGGAASAGPWPNNRAAAVSRTAVTGVRRPASPDLPHTGLSLVRTVGDLPPPQSFTPHTPLRRWASERGRMRSRRRGGEQRRGQGSRPRLERIAFPHPTDPKRRTRYG